MIQNHLLNITHHDSKPRAQNYTKLFITIGSTSHTLIHNHWLSIAQRDGQILPQNNTTSFTTTGSLQHSIFSQPVRQYNTP
jgi:hypothetical protein